MNDQKLFLPQQIDTTRLPPSVTAKWQASVLDEGFVPLPKKLLRSLCRLFPGSPEIQELALLLAAADFRRPSLTREPSLDYLAFVAGLDGEATAHKALGRLEGRGFVRSAERGGGLAVDYRPVQAKVLELTQTVGGG